MTEPRRRPTLHVRAGGYLPDEIRSLRLPDLVPVERAVPPAAIGDPRRAARDALAAVLADRIPAGGRVALALGSRGLGAYRDLVAGALDALRDAGARPFLTPAMGSHGGGTPDGQTRVLREYGLTDLGAPVEADDATRIVARLADGTPVHASQVALGADAIVVLNRVKSHTGFRGRVESGLSKMLVVGLGKRAGAAALHAGGYAGFADRLGEAREALLGAYPPVIGLAVVEDAVGRPARIEAVAGTAIAAREPELLEDAKARMARLPFAKLDVLVVERAGKDVSGLGMDPNVTGRHPSGSREPPDPTRIVLLALTEASEGNAIGMGHADVVTQGFVDAIDPLVTWTNATTSTSLASARLPVVTEDAPDALRLALATCGVAPERARVAWIRDTGHLASFRASRSALDEVDPGAPALVELGPAEPAVPEAG
jgi:hypothetical protein